MSARRKSLVKGWAYKCGDPGMGEKLYHKITDNAIFIPQYAQVYVFNQYICMFLAMVEHVSIEVFVPRHASEFIVKILMVPV